MTVVLIVTSIGSAIGVSAFYNLGISLTNGDGAGAG